MALLTLAAGTLVYLHHERGETLRPLVEAVHQEVVSLREAPFFVPPPPTEAEQATADLKALGWEVTPGAMERAVREGALSPLRLMLKAGMSPEQADAEGKSLLFVAVGEGQTESLSVLLKAGAKPDTRDARGLTPLMAAVREGNLPGMEALLEAGADLHVVDADGHLPLHHAVLGEQAGALRWLLEMEGANLVSVTTPCCNGEHSLLSHALAADHRELLPPVLHHAPTQWETVTREALFGAIRRVDKPLITLLLAHHPEPPTPGGMRQPLLAYAIAWGKPDVLALLLECGADPDTPLQSPVDPEFAALIGPKITRFYLQKEPGMTPLMLAAGIGALEEVQRLLEAGAKKGVRTGKSKIAALSLAAREQHPEVMQVLLGKSPRQEDQRVRIEISLASQRINLFRDGQVVFSSSISTGRKGYATPPGRFVITDKHRKRVSNLYHVEMPYFMRLNCSAIGMHAGVVPGYPASHGCIRLPRSAAVRLFQEAGVGTLVTIR